MPDRSKTSSLFSVLIAALALLAAAGGLFLERHSRDSLAEGAPLEEFTAYLDREIPALLDEYRVPGLSMALIQGGELVWSGAYGYADLENGRRMTVDTVCRAESISKSVSAWGVIKLVESGLLDLDAPLEDYLGDWELPESDFDQRAVSARLLLSNQAGLPIGTIGEEYPPGAPRPSLRENLSQEARLIQPPGKGFIYSNPGFNLLELLVEELTGQDFVSYMAAEVLDPLGMKESSFEWSEDFRGQLPTGYELDGSPVPAYLYPAAASGGLFADVEDLARFVSAGMGAADQPGTSVLKPESIQLLQEPRVEIPGLFGFVADSYGYGLFIENLPDGQQAVWHGGQGHGWMTHFHAVPQSGDGIVILTNSQRSWPLIAEVLADWGAWNEFGPLKFTIINQAVLAARILTGLIALLTLGQLVELVLGLKSGKRRLAPLAPEGLAGRLAQAFFGAAVMAALAWSASRPYSFVSSILPGLVNWLAGGLLCLAAVNLLAACFPSRRDLSGPEAGLKERVG